GPRPTPPAPPSPGTGRLNRAQIASLRGAWSEAEAESVRATEELMEFSPPMAAEALYETGDVRRRRGGRGGGVQAGTRARLRAAAGAGAPPARAGQGRCRTDRVAHGRHGRLRQPAAQGQAPVGARRDSPS